MAQSFKAEVKASVAPITALCFLDAGRVAVGEGSFLKIYEVGTQKCLQTRRVFEKYRIHGISKHDGRLLLWGGKNVTTVSLNDSEQKLENTILVEDWIFFATITDENDIAFITARNELFLARAGSTVAEKIASLSTERCTLYSARIRHYPEQHRILVAAGTVFGEILIWSSVKDDESGEGWSPRLHHRLNDHAGAVFDLDFTEVIEGRRVLGSCSNDRTVRLWDISGADSFHLDVREDSVAKCIAVGWGHHSRIWRVRLVPSEDGLSSLRVVSAAEDLQANVWSLQEKNGEQNLHLDETHLLHSGKSIWSVDVLSEQSLLATGGADGQVAVINFSHKERPLEMHISSLSEKFGITQPLLPTDTDLDPKTSKAILNIKKNFAQYCVIDQNRFIFTTSFGNLFLYDVLKQDWQLLNTWADLRNFSVLASLEGTDLVAIGTNTNRVKILDINKSDEVLSEWTETEFPRLGEFYTSRIKSERGGRYMIAATSASTENISVNLISTSDPSSPAKIPIPVPSEFSLTTSVFFDKDECLLYTGSSKGHLAVFSLDLGELKAELLSLHPSALNSRAMISYIGGYSSDKLVGSKVVLGNRAGRYGIMYFDRSRNTIAELRSSQPPECRIISGAYQKPHTGELFVYGFRGKQFFIRDETNSMEILAEDCGGTNRCWAMCPLVSGEGGYFVWTKASTLGLVHPLPKYRQIVKAGLHGREVKSLSVHGNLIATGSEDTRVCLSRYSSVDRDIRFESFAKIHTSGVHCVKFSDSGRFLFSSGGVEELFAWQVSGIGMTFQSAATPLNRNPDLRIEALDVRELKLKNGESGVFLIAAAYSDAAIRLLVYRSLEKSFTNLYTIPRRDPPTCLTQVVFITYAEKIFLFTGGTNSFIDVWDLSSILHPGIICQKGELISQGFEELSSISQSQRDEPEIVWSRSLHQSAIKSLEIRQADSKLMFATGGDDGAVLYLELDLVTWASASTDIKDAHGAAVGAVVFLPNGKTEQQILSFGVDRKVLLWRVVDGHRLEEIGRWCSGVYDISNASLLRGEAQESGKSRIVVVGVGFEVWEFAD